TFSPPVVVLHGIEEGCGLRPLCAQRPPWDGQPSRVSAGQADMKAAGPRTRYTSSLIGMIPSLPGPGPRERRRRDGRDALTCWVGWLVGLPGLEPGTSSLSEMGRRPR